ncbi:MAG: hypothetical protein AAGB01_06540 [Cyanobacteria bacterium P01_F01_bin.42]
MGFLILVLLLLALVLIYRPFGLDVPSFRQRKRKAQFRMDLLRMRGDADEEIQQKLIAMLGGDREAAERLVARQRFGKGGKYSENYYWQQAIRAVEQSSTDRSSTGAVSSETEPQSSSSAAPKAEPVFKQAAAPRSSSPSMDWQRIVRFPRTLFEQRQKRARSRMQRIKARGEASEFVQARLIRMLDGDREAAERLVARQRFGKKGRFAEEDYWLLAILEIEKKSAREQ